MQNWQSAAQTESHAAQTQTMLAGVYLNEQTALYTIMPQLTKANRPRQLPSACQTTQSNVLQMPYFLLALDHLLVILDANSHSLRVDAVVFTKW